MRSPICRADGTSPEGVQAREYLNDHGIKTVFANVPVPAKTVWKYYARLAGTMFSELPITVSAHVSSEFAKVLSAYAGNHEVDLWQLEWTPYIDMLRGISPAPTLIVAHNVDSLIWQRYHEAETNPLRRWFIKQQWRKFKQFELGVFNRATGVVAVSPDDAAILRQEFGVQNVDVVDNGVDIAHYQAITAKRNIRELLFLGSLDWRPNLDGVRQLLDKVFPRVLENEPQAKLTLVGRHPPRWLTERASATPQVELCANVPDVRPYLARAGMMVVPLRIGGGSRLKILEAFASGLPVVATSVAAEGLRVVPGKDLQIANSVDAMATAITNWLRHPEDAQPFALGGQQVVADQYDWDRLANDLETVWEKTVALGSPVGC